jgi:putative endonuclease
MTFQRQQLGKSGEDLAVAELERRGYAILARRYRTRHGEIDVVARDGETTVFVEVKARTTGEFGGPAVAVTPWKQRRLVSMATDYLARHRLTDRPCRFDVVTVDEAVAGSPVDAAGRGLRGTGHVVTVYRNAFDA